MIAEENNQTNIRTDANAGSTAFLTVTFIVVVILTIILAFSTAQGILRGFISHVALYLLAGRRREIRPLMYAPAIISIGLVWLEQGKF